MPLVYLRRHKQGLRCIVCVMESLYSQAEIEGDSVWPHLKVKLVLNVSGMYLLPDVYYGLTVSSIKEAKGLTSASSIGKKPCHL